MSTKGCSGFFIFLDLELFAKIKKRPGSYTLVFYILINNSVSKQKQKKTNTEHPYVDIVK